MRQEATIYTDQFRYQRKHAYGKILNVGCNCDSAGFRQMGGTNLDLHEVDPITGVPNPVDVIADARKLPYEPNAFDTVVLGEILEHMERSDGVQALKEAKRVLTPNGRVVVTIPHEDRPAPELKSLVAEFYAPGVHAYHYRHISRDEFFEWVKEAGLKVFLWAKIVYLWGTEGSGVLCVA